jgi:hypothetical protein
VVCLSLTADHAGRVLQGWIQGTASVRRYRQGVKMNTTVTETV